MKTTTIRLKYKPPFDWPAILSFFELRSIQGLEMVERASYFRTFAFPDGYGLMEISHPNGDDELIATVTTTRDYDVDDLTLRLRRMFDLDADLESVRDHLSKDPLLAPMISARPAIRVPAHWAPFETAIRAILGQQVSVIAARKLNGRLVDRAGPVIDDFGPERPSRLFPSPEQVLSADLSEMGMPGARVRTLLAVADAYLSDKDLFRRDATPEGTVKRLCQIKGIGPWTAEYIAIRACREPDAFPAGDAGLLRGTADETGQRLSIAALTQRAEAWRPFRAYAAHHIWADDEFRAQATK